MAELDSAMGGRRRLGAVATARALGAGGGIATVTVLAATLGPAGFGVFATATALSSGFTNLSQLGIPPLMQRYVAVLKSRGEDGVAASMAPPLLTVLTSFVAIPLVVVACHLLVGPNAWVAVACAAVFFSRSAHGAIAEGLRAREDFAAFLGVGPGAAAALMGVLFLLIRPTSPAVALGVAAGVALSGAAASALHRNAIVRGLRFLREQRHKLRADLDGAVALSLSATTTFLILEADVLVAASFLGDARTGTYALANRLAVVVSAPLLLLNQANGPILARKLATGDREAGERVAVSVARRASLGTVVVAAAAAIGLSGGVGLGLLPRTYDASVPILLALSFGRFVNSAAGPVANVLILLGDARTVARWSVVSALFAVMFPVIIGPTPITIALGASGGLTLQNCALLGSCWSRHHFHCAVVNWGTT